MKQPIFTGSAVAIITPFKTGGIDLDALGDLLDFQLENGTDAIVVCGTTGEASTMTYQERAEAIEFCVRHVGGRVPVIAGSGSNSTENAVTLSREAVRRGADGLLVVTPYYNKASQAGFPLPSSFTTFPPAPGFPSPRKPMLPWRSTLTSWASRKRRGIWGTSSGPGTSARRISIYGPAMTTRRSPSARWEAGA